MHEARRTPKRRTMRGSEQGVISPKLAVLGLVAAVVVVGAAGYVGLSAVSTGTSHTVRTCAPATSVQCEKDGNLTGSFVAVVHDAGNG